MDWPSRSPGLSSIEHVFDVISWRIRSRIHADETVQLTANVIQVWTSIPQEDIRTLIDLIVYNE